MDEGDEDLRGNAGERHQAIEVNGIVSERLELKPLREILRNAISGLEVNGWLYLPENEKWNLDTPGIVIDESVLDEQELTQDGEPRVAVEQGLKSTLDTPTIEDIAAGSLRFNVPVTDELLFDGFMYYWVHDAFLPEPGAYDPNYVLPPLEERLLSMDRMFYDELGEERRDVQCEKHGCTRGALPLRIFCKIHHFEMMKEKPCPFSD
jgi:hypothetical protein